MAEPATAFVAGATGYVGRALVEELACRGARVIAHVRPDSPDLTEWRSRFAALGAGVSDAAWEPEAMAAALAAYVPTHVFCLVGTTRARARHARVPGESYETVDYGLTQLLLDAAASLPTAPRFVYVSSVGTHARARGAYLRARWRTEEAVHASGLPYTIARPSLITGPDRPEQPRLERIGAWLLGPGLAWTRLFGGARWHDRYRPIDARELAFGLAHAAFHFTTIDRALEGKELRYETANDEEYWAPESRRDAERH